MKQAYIVAPNHPDSSTIPPCLLTYLNFLTYFLTFTFSPAIARALFDEPLTLAAAAAFEEDAARGGAYAGVNPLNDTR